MDMYSGQKQAGSHFHSMRVIITTLYFYNIFFVIKMPHEIINHEPVLSDFLVEEYKKYTYRDIDFRILQWQVYNHSEQASVLLRRYREGIKAISRLQR